MNEQGAQVRKIYRSRRDRVIAGVCGGIAEYFNIDPVWVRIGWVLSVLLKGLGLIAYVLCWILIPEKEEAIAYGGEAASPGGEATSTQGATGAVEGEAGKRRSSIWPLEGSQPRAIIGIVLIVLGCIFALTAFVPFLDGRVFWALVLIALGLVLVAKR